MLSGPASARLTSATAKVILMLPALLGKLRLERFEMIGATCATFFGAAIIFFTIAALSGKRKISVRALWDFCFPGEHWRQRIVRLDVFFYFASKVSDGLFAVVPTVVMITLATALSGAINTYWPHHQMAKAGPAMVVALAVVFFLFADFSNFLTHLLQHKIPVLWEFHKVHHSALFLSPLTTARMHPLGNEFDGLTAGVLTAIPVGVAKAFFDLSFTEVAVMVATANTIGTLMVLDAVRHSHFPISFGPLDWVLMSPHMHQLHHSVKKAHWDKNLGNKLSVWDWMFGTGFMPEKGEVIHYGVGTVEDVRGDYATLVGCYVGPFIKVHAMMLRWARGQSLTQAEKDAMTLELHPELHPPGDAVAEAPHRSARLHGGPGASAAADAQATAS
jgi:sterol desaturase/sphingolipid hydroxylase (fatty acid hydroxylase superfamily)